MTNRDGHTPPTSPTQRKIRVYQISLHSDQHVTCATASTANGWQFRVLHQYRLQHSGNKFSQNVIATTNFKKRYQERNFIAQLRSFVTPIHTRHPRSRNKQLETCNKFILAEVCSQFFKLEKITSIVLVCDRAIVLRSSKKNAPDNLLFNPPRCQNNVANLP